MCIVGVPAVCQLAHRVAYLYRLPAGTLATKDMPKRKGMKGSEADFKKRFGTWMRTALSAKVRLTRAEGVLKGVLALIRRGV